MNRKNTKIGYALGGGAARGLFHIGVLNVLEEYGIYPDIIVGTSMGAIVGALYASGLKADEIKQIACEVDWKQVIRLADITLVPTGGLIQGRRIAALLKSILENRQFSELKYEFSCVATDIYTGEQIVLSEGSLIEAIRASISIPGIFTPVKINERYLVDGGLINVVPVSVCRNLGADLVIGVNVISDPSDRVMTVKIGGDYHKGELGAIISEEDEMQKPIVANARIQFHGNKINRINNAIKKFLLYRQPKLQRLVAKSPSSVLLHRPQFLATQGPNVIDVLGLSLTLIEYRIAMENLKDADLAINPVGETVGFWEFYRAAEAISAGEKAMRLALERDTVARILFSKSGIE